MWCTKPVTHHISEEEIKVPCPIKWPQNIPGIFTGTLLAMACSCGHPVRACTAFVMDALPFDFWSDTQTLQTHCREGILLHFCFLCTLHFVPLQPWAASACKLEKPGVLLSWERLWASIHLLLPFFHFLPLGMDRWLPVVLQPVSWATEPSEQLSAA